MTHEAILSGTGHPPDHWFTVIRKAGLGDSPHKNIADYLHNNGGLTYWWAQSVAVEYEYSIGRRITGQTQEGKFQLGVNRTLRTAAARVWEFLESSEGLSILFGEDGAGITSLSELDGQTSDGVAVLTTTYAEGSHVRLRWHAPGWENHSILQIRVTPKGSDRCVLTFHQEKLPAVELRAVLIDRWKAAAAAVAGAVDPASAQTPGT